jgi:hypothetical protein
MDTKAYGFRNERFYLLTTDERNVQGNPLRLFAYRNVLLLYSRNACNGSPRYVIKTHTVFRKGPGSSVVMAGYGLDDPEIESRWGEIFRRPEWPWDPPSLLYSGYRVLPGGKAGRAVMLSPQPF